MNETKDLILCDLYYSPKTGYRSAQHLWELALEEDDSFTLNQVRDWLQHQETYTQYKTFNNPQFFRHTFVRYLGEQVQMDLIVLGKFADTFPYILMVIELLSRYAFAYPLWSKSADSTLNQIQLFLHEFEARFHTKPKLIQFDEGGEFLNKKSKTFFDQQDITYFTTFSRRKASIVERLNRTMKEKIVKYRETQPHWGPALQDMVDNYNTQDHRSIGMSPAQVNASNQYTVWGRLFGKIMPHVQPRFKLGDHVRVLHFNPKGPMKTYMTKKYPPPRNAQGKPIRHEQIKKKMDAPFSQEVFRITQVLLGDPVVYKLYSDEAKLDILGKFYEDELSLYKI